jgi:hypothetical protein
MNQANKNKSSYNQAVFRLFNQQTRLKFKEATSEILHREIDQKYLESFEI